MCACGKIAGKCDRCLRSKVDQLRAEVADSISALETMGKLHGEVCVKLSDSLHDNDRLRAALRKYGQHIDVDCDETGTLAFPCLCGLDATLNGAGGED
jgi:hypothetical protein